jgi:bifunctional non-homologous end joining protein LigD
MAKSKLADYQAKRDFTRTGEPSGKVRIREVEYPRFVIQKHAATRLHYDLRLEHAGVFKSWAVTKGPSLDPADKRLAVEVEDHPLDYGDFEGTIPKGEYGGGTVMLWDRGFWMPEGDSDIDKALGKGELKFTLAGQKLQGSWVLVRMRRDREHGKRNNWLLIKHRDGYERDRDGDAALARDKSVASGRSMEQIAAGKGRGPNPFMTAGATASDPRAIWHSNKQRKAPRALAPLQATPRKTAVVTSAPIPRFIGPQFCKTVTHPPSGADWVHEIKLDGYRMQLRVADGKATLRTRKGLDWTDKFRATADVATALPDCMIDGEVVALDKSGTPNFSALQAALSEGRSEDLVYFAFDLLFAEGRDWRAQPLTQRKARLKDLLQKYLPDATGIGYVGHVSGSGDAVLRSACAMKLEGIVSKRLSASYRSERTEAWLKAKCRPGHEVVIGGWSGTTTNLRSLVAGVYRGDHLVYVGQVGTGFNARNSKSLLQKLKAEATDKSPFGGKDAPRRQMDWTWVKPVLVAEIEFAGWTDAGMVRAAAYKGLREDKPAREISAEVPAAPDEVDPIMTPSPQRQSQSQSQSKSKSKSKSNSTSPGNVVLGVTISKPEKVLWPAEEGHDAVTKLDLAHYLQEVGPWIIEHLKGRPCSVIRAPDGIHGQKFFQRHAMRGVSKLVTLTTVEGDREPYVQIDSVEALIAMGQIAALEYHPWNCEPFRPAIPGRLVFDLDPAPDVNFDAVIVAAKELRQRLERLGLITFCKTTGGKGLHMVTPLQVKDGDAVGWDEAKGFAQAVCADMANGSPDRYLLNMAKKQRTGRIFLDYLRNDRMSTAVAPLSPRMRVGAPVSMPLTWTQVNKGLDPMRFTLRTAPGLLRKSKAWKDYCDAERPLAAAIKKLVGTSRRKSA